MVIGAIDAVTLFYWYVFGIGDLGLHIESPCRKPLRPQAFFWFRRVFCGDSSKSKVVLGMVVGVVDTVTRCYDLHFFGSVICDFTSKVHAEKLLRPQGVFLSFASYISVELCELYFPRHIDHSGSIWMCPGAQHILFWQILGVFSWFFLLYIFQLPLRYLAPIKKCNSGPILSGDRMQNRRSILLLFVHKWWSTLSTFILNHLPFIFVFYTFGCVYLVHPGWNKVDGLPPAPSNSAATLD